MGGSESGRPALSSAPKGEIRPLCRLIKFCWKILSFSTPKEGCFEIIELEIYNLSSRASEVGASRGIGRPAILVFRASYEPRNLPPISGDESFRLR
jgi:hypothetical protein